MVLAQSCFLLRSTGFQANLAAAGKNRIRSKSTGFPNLLWTGLGLAFGLNLLFGKLQGIAEPVYGARLKDGTGLYHTNFIVPGGRKGNPAYTGFGRMQSGYSLWVNGQYAGEFANAFNPQTFDVSPFVAPGKFNTLAVKVISNPKGQYYVLSSGLTGWAPNPNKYATATSLSGPWSEFKDIAPPQTNTYGSQSSMLIKIEGTNDITVIFIGDVWKPKTQWDSWYLWMPLLIGDGKLWLPEPAPWTLNVKTGEAAYSKALQYFNQNKS